MKVSKTLQNDWLVAYIKKLDKTYTRMVINTSDTIRLTVFDHAHFGACSLVSLLYIYDFKICKERLFIHTTEVLQ